MKQSKIGAYFNNLPLAKKMYVIISILFTFLCIVFLAGLNVLVKAYNESLYDSTAHGLRLVISEVDRNLQEIETASNEMIIDAVIQDTLMLVNAAENIPQKACAISDLYNRFFKYLDTPNIRSLSIVLPNGKIISTRGAAAFSDQLLKQANTLSRAANGKAVWISPENDPNIVFCARDIRKLQYLKLDHLGTLMIAVDLSEIADKAITEHTYPDDMAQILITDADRIVYTNNGIDPDKFAIYRFSDSADEYTMMSIDEKKVFAISGNLPSVGWTYSYLIDYDHVFHQIRAVQVTVIFITVLAALVALTLAAQCFHSVFRHIHFLVRKIHMFGEQGVIPPDPNNCYELRGDEIGQLHRAFNDMTHSVMTLRNENYDKQILLSDARIKMLQQQMNPHFLYNTLETINWMALGYGAGDIVTIVKSLANLFRASISSDSERVPLKKELSFLSDYIKIQRIRFGNRLVFCQDIPEKLLDVKVPGLCIQPLVENALKYALEENDEVCTVRVSAEDQGDIMELCVSNTGSAFDADIMEKLENEVISSQGTGVGLINMNRRLKLIYGEEYGLRLFNQDGCAVVVVKVLKEVSRDAAAVDRG